MQKSVPDDDFAIGGIRYSRVRYKRTSLQGQARTGGENSLCKLPSMGYWANIAMELLRLNCYNFMFVLCSSWPLMRITRDILAGSRRKLCKAFQAYSTAVWKSPGFGEFNFLDMFSTKAWTNADFGAPEREKVPYIIIIFQFESFELTMEISYSKTMNNLGNLIVTMYITCYFWSRT